LNYERHELGEPGEKLPGRKAKWKANIPTRYHKVTPPWSDEFPESLQFEDSGLITDYVSNMPKMDKAGMGLLLLGPHGTGKTALACRVLAESMARGQHVAHFCFASEIDWCARHRGDETASGAKRWQLLTRDAQWLVIDDLGMERDAEWNRRWLEEVLTSRYAWKVPTIITSNWSAEEIEERSPRLHQLMKDAYTVVDCTGISWRS
jgi:DNA replication protein DnaC